MAKIGKGHENAVNENVHQDSQISCAILATFTNRTDLLSFLRKGWGGEADVISLLHTHKQYSQSWAFAHTVRNLRCALRSFFRVAQFALRIYKAICVLRFKK